MNIMAPITSEWSEAIAGRRSDFNSDENDIPNNVSTNIILNKVEINWINMLSFKSRIASEIINKATIYSYQQL